MFRSFQISFEISYAEFQRVPIWNNTDLRDLFMGEVMDYQRLKNTSMW